MKTLVTLLTAALLACSFTACGGVTSAPPGEVEIEDCDFGDALEGDSDCYGASGSKGHKPKAGTKPKVKIKSKPRSGRRR